MAESDEVKKLSEVSTKLSEMNQTQQIELGNVKALTQTLVNQSKASLMAQEATASAENEARKEASRARKDTAGAQDVNVLNWEDRPKDESSGGLLDSLKEMLMMKFSMGGFSLGSLFKKGGLKTLFATLGTTLFGGIKTAFAAVGGTMSGVLGPTLMKFLSPMALITGLVLAIKDGFAGAMNAMDWGVSKISGFLGGFFGGDADGGIMNAFKNAGKWALIGAGIGSVVPVVGTLLGGLVGMAIGGILGLIGAKKIAKAFDSLGAWISLKWTEVTGYVKDIWGKVSTFFTEQWDKIKEFLFGALDFATEGLAAGWTSLSGFVSEKWNQVSKFFKDLLTFENEGGEKIGIGEKILELFKQIPDKIITMFHNIVNSIMSIIPGMGGADKASSYWDWNDMGSKEVDVEKLQKNVSTMSKEDLEALKAGMLAEQKKKGLDNAQEVFDIIAARSKQFAAGGPVKQTGMAVLHGTSSAPELVLDNQAAALFMKAANLIASIAPPEPVDNKLIPSAHRNLMASAAESLFGLQLDKIGLNNTAAAGNATIINNVQNSAVGGPSISLPRASLRPQSTNTLPTS